MLLWIVIVVIILFIISIPVFFAFAPQIGAKPTGERLNRLHASTGNRDGKFQNVIETTLDLSFSTILKSLYRMMNGEKDKVPSKPINTLRFNKQQFNELGNDGVAAIAWFGHTSVLIKIHGKVFLTDPVFVGKRASMLPFLGPKRFPYTHYLELDELPHIDAVLLSHDHYDHLDYPTIRALKNTVNHFIAPLGVGAHLEKWGIPAAHIAEFDWWDQFNFNENIRFTCTPTRHFSGRALSGRNTTLWCSWIIEGKLQRIYFGADSGYSPSFKEIGALHGPFDVCILECGAYSEYWPEIHMMPEETMKAFLDLKGKRLMPVHWAKFNLSLHGWKDPIRRLRKQVVLTGAEIIAPRIGEAFEVGKAFKQEEWWEE